MNPPQTVVTPGRALARFRDDVHVLLAFAHARSRSRTLEGVDIAAAQLHADLDAWQAWVLTAPTLGAVRRAAHDGERDRGR